MGAHRFRDVLTTGNQPTHTQQHGICLNAFAFCPVAPGPALTIRGADWQQQLYQLAFEQAQAAAHRPRPQEGNWIGAWN
jgi:hypothetical protein